MRRKVLYLFSMYMAWHVSRGHWRFWCSRPSWLLFSFLDYGGVFCWNWSVELLACIQLCANSCPIEHYFTLSLRSNNVFPSQFEWTYYELCSIQQMHYVIWLLQLWSNWIVLQRLGVALTSRLRHATLRYNEYIFRNLVII